jgi:hypothetical protein
MNSAGREVLGILETYCRVVSASSKAGWAARVVALHYERAFQAALDTEWLQLNLDLTFGDDVPAGAEDDFLQSLLTHCRICERVARLRGYALTVKTVLETRRAGLRALAA